MITVFAYGVLITELIPTNGQVDALLMPPAIFISQVLRPQRWVCQRRDLTSLNMRAAKETVSWQSSVARAQEYGGHTTVEKIGIGLPRVKPMRWEMFL